jgi:hypothetical protein
MAIAHTAAEQAADAVTKLVPAIDVNLEPVPGASVDPAIAVAHHAALTRLLPSPADARFPVRPPGCMMGYGRDHSALGMALVRSTLRGGGDAAGGLDAG